MPPCDQFQDKWRLVEPPKVGCPKPGAHALRDPCHPPSAWPGCGPGLVGSAVAGGKAGWGVVAYGTPCLPTPPAQPSQFLFFYFEFVFEFLLF